MVDTANHADQTSVRGPPLASRPHTFRVIVLLFLHSLLLFLALVVLPAHLLWRKAVKQYGNVNAQPIESADHSVAAYDAVQSSTLNTDSALRNMITALRILFTSLQSDVVAMTWIKKGFRSTFAAIVLLQGWFLARFKGWWDEAEAMDHGDRDEVLKRRNIGMAKQMEVNDSSLLQTSNSLAFAECHYDHVCTASSNCILLCCHHPLRCSCCPVSRQTFLSSDLMSVSCLRQCTDTLLLAGYLSILTALPAMHLLGTSERNWIKSFSRASAIVEIRRTTPRFYILGYTITCTLLGSLVGSAGLLLDWEKAWQVSFDSYPLFSLITPYRCILCLQFWEHALDY